jgi:hypothetical protein
MCIANLNGFNMDWALEVQRNAYIETNTTFGDLKGVHIFRVVEKTIKQVKRLQNPKMVDGNDKNDMELNVIFCSFGKSKLHFSF